MIMLSSAVLVSNYVFRSLSCDLCLAYCNSEGGWSERQDLLNEILF